MPHAGSPEDGEIFGWFGGRLIALASNARLLSGVVGAFALCFFLGHVLTGVSIAVRAHRERPSRSQREQGSYLPLRMRDRN